MYGASLFEEVYKYSEVAKIIALSEDFDVIHCHDWMTVAAGINAKKASGKPLVFHMHNTVFDRCGDNPNNYEYGLEKWGFDEADTIIAISHFTKNKIITKYNIPDNKIEVVHNGISYAPQIIPKK